MKTQSELISISCELLDFIQKYDLSRLEFVFLLTITTQSMIDIVYKEALFKSYKPKN